MRLHHVQVSCPPGGEDAARRLYAGALGIPEVEKPPVLAARGGCWFRGESVEVHVGVEASFVPANKAHRASWSRTSGVRRTGWLLRVSR